MYTVDLYSRGFNFREFCEDDKFGSSRISQKLCKKGESEKI